MLGVHDIFDHKLENSAMIGGSKNSNLQTREAPSVVLLQVRLEVMREDVYQLWSMNIWVTLFGKRMR